MLNSKQRSNGILVLRQVSKRAIAGGWSPADARRVAVMAIMCCLTESELRNYANTGVPASMSIPHDAVGSDHASVGVFQQQTGTAWSTYSTMGSQDGWGKPAELMNVAYSANLFINRVLALGLSKTTCGVPTHLAVQKVQGSAFDDGSNYKRNRSRAYIFVWWHWIAAKRTAK